MEGESCIILVDKVTILFIRRVFIRSIGGYYFHDKRDRKPPFNLVSYMDGITKQIKWSPIPLPYGIMKYALYMFTNSNLSISS